MLFSPPRFPSSLQEHADRLSRSLLSAVVLCAFRREIGAGPTPSDDTDWIGQVQFEVTSGHDEESVVLVPREQGGDDARLTAGETRLRLALAQETLRLDLEKSPNPRRVLAEVSDAWELSE